MADIQIMDPTPCSICGETMLLGEFARPVGWRRLAHVRCAVAQ